MRLKFGYQTIIWGAYPIDRHHLNRFGRMLDVIRDAGFTGVEFFQNPKELPPYDQLTELLREKNPPLELLGLAEGSLADRVEYLSGDKSPYLYLDRELDERAREFMEDGYRIAIHPHHLGGIDSFAKAKQLLRDNPKLLCIPDSAHAAIKREDVRKEIREHLDQLAAVHIKDWRPGFGRISALYARGLTELGEGEVRDSIRDVLDYLSALPNPESTSTYTGWVVVEQDYSEGLIEDSVQRSSTWLQKGKFIGARSFVLDPEPQGSDQPEDNEWTRQIALGAHRLSSSDLNQLYERLAQAFQEAFASMGVEAVALWSRSARDDVLTLQALEPPEDVTPPETVLQVCDCWLENDEDWSADPSIKQSLGLGDKALGRRRLTIRSMWNPHVIRLVVDLFAPSDFQVPTPQRFLERTVGRAFDLHLDKIMLSNAAEVNRVSSANQDLDSFCRDLRQVIRESLNCENVAMFLTDSTGIRLEPTPGTREELNWSSENQRFYVTDDGHPTTLAWQDGEPVFTNRRGDEPDRPDKAKSWLKSDHSSRPRVLYMPVISIEKTGSLATQPRTCKVRQQAHDSCTRKASYGSQFLRGRSNRVGSHSADRDSSDTNSSTRRRRADAPPDAKP